MGFKKIFTRLFCGRHEGQASRNDEGKHGLGKHHASSASPTGENTDINLVQSSQNIRDARCRLDVTLEAARKLEAALLERRPDTVPKNYEDDGFWDDSDEEVIKMQKLRNYYVRQARRQVVEIQELESVHYDIIMRRSTASK